MNAPAFIAGAICGALLALMLIGVLGVFVALMLSDLDSPTDGGAGNE